MTELPLKSLTPLQRGLLCVGAIGPLGHLPASGTATVAVLGVPAFAALSRLESVWQVVVIIVFAGAAMWLHDVGDRLLGARDSRKLVWDELAGFLVAVSFLSFSWKLAILAILLERTLDILKPFPANWIDRHWHGGVGVVADDLVAGTYTCLLLHAVVDLAPAWFA